MKKSNKLSSSSTGTKKNSNSGPSQANKKKKIMSSCKNTEKKMMQKSDNLTSKLKSWLWKFPENSRNSIRKSHQLKPVKLNSTKQLKSSRKSTTKDTFYSPNGKKWPKLSPTEIKTSTELVKISLPWWIKSTPIKKLLTKEKDNLITKRNSIVKMKPEMFWVTETLVIEKMNWRDWNSRELLTCKLKFKSWKINFHRSQPNSPKPEMELRSRIKIFCKRSKDFKLNKLNLMLSKQNSKTNFCSSKSSMSPKVTLRLHSRKSKTKGRELNQTFPYKKIFW